MLLTLARWPKIVQIGTVIQNGLQKYLLVEELCSEFVFMEKYFLPKHLKNTNMTLQNFWYFEDIFSNCLRNLGETWQQYCFFFSHPGPAGLVGGGGDN